MRITPQRGSVLITLIVAMMMMASLGGAIYSMTGASAVRETMSNNNDNAYDLARAGIRYGTNYIASHQNPVNLDETTFQMPDANHLFSVTIVNNLITAKGVVNPGTSSEAVRILTYDNSWPLSTSSEVISSTDNIQGFLNPVVSNPNAAPGSQAITVNETTKEISLGNGTLNAGGTILYQGSNASANCVNGACAFNVGLRAYFDFTISGQDSSADSTGSADGFTFVMLSANKNSPNLTGGAAVVSQGELMGYAGPDGTADMLGLQAPKIALELDTYPNTGTGDVCASGTRNDPTIGGNFYDHGVFTTKSKDLSAKTVMTTGNTLPG